MKNKKHKVTDLIYSFDLIKQLSFFKGDSKKEKEFEEWLNKKEYLTNLNKWQAAKEFVKQNYNSLFLQTLFLNLIKNFKIFYKKYLTFDLKYIIKKNVKIKYEKVKIKKGGINNENNIYLSKM